MDKFFKAIGRFFKGIWDWIKSTAWVQPLLIVVIVFAVIFSFSSSSPLMKWIKSLSNSDTTGEFYDQHKKIAFHDLYKDIYSNTPMYQCEEGKRPDGSKAGTALNSEKYDGYTYVVFITIDDATESSFKTFYNNTLTKEERSHFYVIDFREDENLKSGFQDTKNGWKAYNDNSAVYYSYLLDHLHALFDSEEYETFNDEFNKKYGYNSKFTEVWDYGTDINNPASDLKFPLICKYKGETLIDFRFCNDFSGNYDGKDAPTVLNDFHKGI